MNSSSCRARRPVFSFILASCLVFCAAWQARAATVPSGFTDTIVAGNLTNATAMAIAPDGRVFVCLQGGALRVVKNGALLPTPFLTVAVNASGERGLLGVAFDPNFNTNGYVYVYYTTAAAPIHNRVSRFTANGDVAVAGSELVLLDLDNLSGATNHNGGAMHFGPDGKLYVAVGENATPSNAQTLANLLGKMLRINPDGSIPTDNPFYATATGRNRAIWALGLRNPYTFNFQPGTGRMFINDVGQNAFEEINDGIAGSNYGWPTCEGACTNPNFRNPLFQYGHGFGATTGCAITGGAFYNPETQQFPASYAGKYFFADFCSNWIRLFDPASGAATDFASAAASPVDLQVSADGSLYYLQRGSTGQLRRIQYPAGQLPPSVATHPQSQTVAAGQPVTFTVSATGSTPLRYQWQRNNADIPGANSESYTLPAADLADNGAQFRVVVTNAFGSATSNSATLTVTSTNTTPSAGALLITEYRLDGAGGLRDEFVELYNNTDAPITVATADNSAGWALVTGRDTAAAGGVALETYVVVPNGTQIPARAHYLVAGDAYSLSGYGGVNRALADVVSQNDLSGDDAEHPFRGVALFRTANANNFTAANRLDAAGGACADARLSEGRVSGLCRNVGTAASPAANYSLVRRQPTGVPQDTDNNADDFALVAVQSPLPSAGAGANLTAELGAPGPENLNSPTQHNATIKASLIDPQAASTLPPNRVRAGGQIPNGQFGTLTIRRRFTNKTGRTVLALRFRLTGITTLGTPVDSSPQADLRATSSSDAEVQTSGGLIIVKGTILEQPPAQTLGGGLNSTLVVPLTGGSLIPNASVDVQFVLGVQQEGSFRFLVNVEALTQPAAASQQKGAWGKANR